MGETESDVCEEAIAAAIGALAGSFVGGEVGGGGGFGADNLARRWHSFAPSILFSI